MKYGNLNLLEPSGPLQACNGAALLLWGSKQKAHWSGIAVVTSEWTRTVEGLQGSH